MPSIQTRDRAGVALQRVVDRHRVEHRAAGAVQPQRQRAVVGQRAELGEEALRRDAVGADLVIDRDFRARVAGADRIPGSHGVSPRRFWKPLGRRPGALRLAGLRAVAEAEFGRPGSVRRVLAVDLLDVVAGRLDRLAPRQQTGVDRQHLRLDVLQRIDPVPARRDPLDRAPACRRRGKARQIERAGEHRRLHPARPDRAAKLVRDHPVLQLLDPPAELDELGPQARIVRLAHVAGHQMVRQPERGRDREAACGTGTPRSRRRRRPATRTSRPRPAAAPAECRAPGSPWRCRRRRPASRRAAPPRARSW